MTNSRPTNPFLVCPNCGPSLDRVRSTSYPVTRFSHSCGAYWGPLVDMVNKRCQYSLHPFGGLRFALRDAANDPMFVLIDLNVEDLTHGMAELPNKQGARKSRTNPFRLCPACLKPGFVAYNFTRWCVYECSHCDTAWTHDGRPARIVGG